MKERESVSRRKGKLLLVLGVFALLLFGTALTASAAVRQNGVKNKAVSVSWDDPNEGMTYSRTTKYHLYAGTDRDHITIQRDLPATQRSITLTGLRAGEEYYVEITCDYDGSYNSYKDSYVGRVYAQTLPAKPVGLKVDYYSNYMTSVEYAWNTQDISGWQWVLRDAAGSTVDYGVMNYASSSPSVLSSKIKAKSIYTFQVRGFSKAYNSNTAVYGPWSDRSYFVPQPQLKGKKYTKVNGNGTLSVKWTKVKGADSYTVYVHTKAKGKYKKMATVKKNSVKLKNFKGKKFKNNKYYYIYVVANKKVGKAALKSPNPQYWYVRRSVY